MCLLVTTASKFNVLTDWPNLHSLQRN